VFWDARAICYDEATASQLRQSGAPFQRRRPRIRGGTGMVKTIGNPLSWSANHIAATSNHLAHMAETIGSHDTRSLPVVRAIDLNDIRQSLRLGFQDFVRFRSDVITMAVLYPAIGICLAFLAFQGNFFQLVFPVISGFALVGPVAAVGFYEMSRRQEAGQEPSWAAPFDVINAPGFGAILAFSFLLFGIFATWLLAANSIYAETLGPALPASPAVFVNDVLSTGAGWTMTLTGIVVGFLFAAVVLSISVVTIPLLLDRNCGLPVAIATSMRVTARSPWTVALWGLIIAGLLAIGSLPVLLGLIVVLPVLGHASWHLYRRSVV
jgi:uncharacterized membrane protein